MDSEFLSTGKIIDYFKAPTLFAPREIFEDKELIPDKKGLYGWYFNYYFDKLFEKDSIDHLIHVVNGGASVQWVLMYIGIGGDGSDRTLRERIYKNHLTGTSRNSTFRKSLAALLCGKLNLEPQNRLNGQDRDILNSWLFEHGRIAWITCDNPDVFESKIFDEVGYILPFNIQKNKRNPWLKKLKSHRKPWAKKH
jgi:hypothetical protein